MNAKAQLAVVTVLLGCCSNVVFLELLVKEAPGIGNLVTFSQFLVIAIEGFLFTTRCGTLTPSVPYSAWFTLVVMYFFVSVTNNYALNFHIPMPLHMIFRAGSLMANMIMGIILLGKRYSMTKYMSVSMISVGIATCTIMSAGQKKEAPLSEHDGEEQSATEAAAAATVAAAAEAAESFWLMVGIGLLTFALFMSARMGIYQEVIYGKYGKHPKEALYYTHALPLPGFLLLAPDILHHWAICLSSAPFVLPLVNLQVPSMLMYLLGNVITQYLCISSVFVLTTECASLTVTLVVTLRKFLSLLFSIWYFQNPFTLMHWFGTILVFGGTILFSDIPAMVRAQREAGTKKAS